MATKVTPVQCFKTSDGQFFEDEDTAHSEQAKVDLKALLMALADWPANKEAAFKWLCANRKAVEAIDLLLQEIY